MTTSRSWILALGLTALAAGIASAQQAAAPQTAPQPRRITLAEALRLAQENDPAMVQAQQNVRVANMATLQSWGAYLPTINGTGSASRNSSQRVNQFGIPQSSANTDNSSFGISASLPLFTGFQRGANRRAADANADLNRAALVGQDYATALATKQAFFNALATQELVGVAQSNLRRSDEQLKLISEKLRLGATTRADSLSASVDYGNAQLQLIQAQANALTGQANLARAVGVEGMVAAAPDTTLEVRVPVLDTATLRSEALAGAPAVVEAQAGVTAARASLAASRSPLMPTVSLGASQTWAGAQLPWAAPPVNRVISGPDTTFVQSRRYTGTWSLRLSMSYPIFNGFQREAGIVQADANLVSSRAKLRDARLALDANLTQAFTALAAAGSQIDVARTSVAAAQENLRMQRERYRLGASTIVDLLTAEVTLNQAEVSLVQARYNYLVARAQIEAYVGHSL
jgi:TolC family type I secretion outer membrane protein